VNILSYADFSSKVHSASSKKRIPFDVGLDLTYRCNNRCVHCYCNLPADDKQALQDELTTEEVKNLLDELASMGSLWLLITGGEPLLRPDFEEIYLHAKKKGFIITLFTNGTLINERIVRLLSQCPPFYLEISLYGATRDTYEKITRVQGSYGRCIDGIKRIVNAAIKLNLKTMALTINKNEIEAIDKMALELGCKFRFDPMLHKRIDDKRSSDYQKYRISPEDIIKLDKMFPRRMEEWHDFCNKFVKEPIKDDKLYKCGAGINTIHINPYGIAMGCAMMGMDGFSSREHSLKWIWDKGIPSIINQKKNFPLPCDNCSLISLCGQCAPWSILENGDVKKEVTYLCEIAKIRAKNFEFINL
jgi:radical SAM protein with 4Fe4S-binding SPASM domain